MSRPPQNDLAFFGLGNMGFPMALNLSRAFPGRVSAFDPAAAARRRAADAGLAAAEPAAFNPDQNWRALFTMLPDAAAVEALLLGENNDGLLPRLGPRAKGMLLVDCSTTGPEAARRLAAAAARQNARFADAPVSGGIAGAAAAKLSFLVGGETSALNRARPFLKKMGAAVFHAGPAGAGQTAKLCNNMLLSVLMIGTCEALTLGAAAGLDPATLSEIMRRSSGGNWTLEVYNPWPGVMENSAASRNYEGGFLTDLMVKDSDLALAAAAELDALPPLMGELANKIYRLHQKLGWGRKDFSSILQTLRALPPPDREQ